MVWCGIFFLLGNRVSKTRFINQKNFKKKFKKSRNTTIRSEGERILKSDRRGDLGRALPSLGRAQSGSRTVRDLGSSLMFWILLSFFFFFFFFGRVLFWYVLGSYLMFIKVINQVLETRFPCDCHVEKYATSGVIRPWKSSLWVSIYRPKSSLKDSRC